ncbi:MAG: UTP:GlnB (protein PII) uridylyltransferase, partial [bacterium]
LKEGFCSLVYELYRLSDPIDEEEVKNAFFTIFTADYTSVAVSLMIEIATPPSRNGHIKTLLGRILPEVNKMRFLLRNVNVHEHPLCIHSLKALKEVEIEITKFQNEEAELWAYITPKDLFALKWSTLFHDLGKIDPYRDHEAYGPKLSTNMLKRLGWEDDEDVMNLVRLLVLHHQSVVRYSRMSTYMDIGIVKFFELAQRDLKKLILLYLVNLCDYKSVNKETYRKTKRLEELFNESLKILYGFKGEPDKNSLVSLVNDYFYKKKDDLEYSVLLELLLQRCVNKGLFQELILPLKEINVEEAENVESQKRGLEGCLRYLTLGGLDPSTIEKHSNQFIQITKRLISRESVITLLGNDVKDLNWFFQVFPNRYLLTNSSHVLVQQLFHFENFRDEDVIFSYVAGSKGEYDTLLFHCHGKEQVLQKVAYALGQKEINIISGKVNLVDYGDGKLAYVGYFNISVPSYIGKIVVAELQNVVSQLTPPPLQLTEKEWKSTDSSVLVNYYREDKKAYVIQEKENEFIRERKNVVAVKISFGDASFTLFKILKAFDKLQIIPQSINITTTSDKSTDYFYIHPNEKKLLDQSNFESSLIDHLFAQIAREEISSDEG